MSAGALPATFAATASDDATGIDKVVINFDKSLSTGPGSPGQIIIDGTAADDWTDGDSAFTHTVPQNLESGTYNITSVEVIDNAGNSRTYTPAQLQAAEFYREQGFEAEGKVYKDAGLLHQDMRKKL